MSQPRFHLAQANYARMRAPLTDPLMAGFVAQLEPLNALADRSPGFIWRLQSEEGDATAIRVFEDERILFNMSVWESLEALSNYTYRSGHADIFRNRRAWFETLAVPTLVLWWIPAAHLPTVEEAKARFDLLHRRGPTPHAFTFKQHWSIDSIEIAFDDSLSSSKPRS